METRELNTNRHDTTFPRWLIDTRRSLGLTQRQIGGIPAGTIAAYESGRRTPRSVIDVARLARALKLPLCSVYRRLEAGKTARSRLGGLLANKRYQEAYATLKSRQWAAQSRADTTELMATEALLGTLAQRIPESEALSPLINDPHEALNAAGWALRNSQLTGALVLLRPLETTLPPSGRLYQRLLNNLFYAHRALGDETLARHWASQYIAWAESEGDRWRAVLAHTLWLEAGGCEGVPSDVAEPHLAVLAEWRRIDTGATDPGVLAWEWDARARTALSCGHMGQADRYVRQLRQLLDDHPLWYAEWVRLAEVSARLKAEHGHLAEAIADLRRVLTGPEAQALPRWQRLEATHTLVRLITQLDPDQGAEKWRQIIQIHRTLEAYPWIDRLYPEWAAVDASAAIDMAPVLI